MAKITRIKASEPNPKEEKASKKALKPAPKAKEVDTEDTESNDGKPEKAAKTTARGVKDKPFILVRPFVYLGRYIRGAFLELKMVRWPSRKATWKLVVAIFVYTAIFIALIMLLDALFTWLFGLIIG